MNIIEKVIPVNHYNRPGQKHTPLRICVHYTGDCGATGERLAMFYSNVAHGAFKDKPNSWTSTHYIVGLDGEIIRIIPDSEIAYAAANKNNGTLHIEVCYKETNGKFEQKSIDSLSLLVQYLMDSYGILPENVVRHFDLTGKKCPAYYAGKSNTEWAALHKAITTSDTELYYIQVGAFNNVKHADMQAKMLEKRGFEGVIKFNPETNMYHVQAGAFRNKDNAVSFMNALNRAGFPTVLKVGDLF